MPSLPDALKPSSTYERVVWALATASAVIVVSVVALRTTPEAFPLGSEIGDALFDLSLAFLAAVFFYLLIEKLPRFEQNRNFLFPAMRQIHLILAIEEEFRSELSRMSGVDIPTPLTDVETGQRSNLLDRALAKVDTYSDSTNYGSDQSKLSLNGLLADGYLRTDMYLARIRPYLPYLDESLATALASMDLGWAMTTHTFSKVRRDDQPDWPVVATSWEVFAYFQSAAAVRQALEGAALPHIAAYNDWQSRQLGLTPLFDPPTADETQGQSGDT